LSIIAKTRSFLFIVLKKYNGFANCVAPYMKMISFKAAHPCTGGWITTIF